jgi:hypothetical protein
LKTAILFLAFLLAYVCFAQGAMAKPASHIPTLKPVIVTYDVYVGGIHLLTTEALFEETGRRYHAHVTGQTYGFWYKIFPWQTELNTDGVMRGNKFMPSVFMLHDVWGEKHKKSTMRFLKHDVAMTYDPPENDKGPGALTSEQKKGVLDPITALLQMLAHVAIQKNCNVTTSVFDGKRRFDVIGMDNGYSRIDGDDLGVFTGDARLCDVQFKAVAGQWTEKVKEKFWKKSGGNGDRDPFHVWLATISPDLPEMAVRAETDSVWGNIVAHLSGWRWADVKDKT